MKVVIRSEEELAHEFREVVNALANLRKFTKLWEGNYGVALKEKKKRWEAKSDELLKRLQESQIKIKS
jgi:hypothetical protein